MSQHIVNFEEYCHKCEHFNVVDWDDPCHDCMENPAVEDSHKPLYFKDRNEGENETDRGSAHGSRRDA